MSRYRRIAELALPIVGAMVSQNVLNLVDTAMVGSLGDAAIAAVSTASFVNFACVALLTGLSFGVQAMAARRFGEGRPLETTVALNAGLLCSIVLGLPMMAVLIAAAPIYFPWINGDPDVVAHAVPYLQTRLLGMVAIGLNFSYRGFWNGIDRPRSYLWTLLVMHGVNIAASYVLIFGRFGAPELGSMGAGVGGAIGAWVGVVTYVGLGLRRARDVGFPGQLPTWEAVRTLLVLSIPTSLQQVLFAAGLTTLFAIVARLGTAEVAAAGVLINITLVAFLPGVALGLTATTLVSQALGRGDAEDASRWAWDVVRVGVVGMGLLGLPMLLAPELLLAPFLPGRPETIAVAAPALRIVGGLMWVDGIGMVLMQALLGAGASRQVAVVAIGMQWVYFLPTAVLVGPWAGGGLTAIWIAQSAQRVLQALVFAAIWRRGSWKTIRV